MNKDEAENRSGPSHHAGRRPAGSDGDSSPLQTRANFLKDWNWQFVTDLNRGTCERGKAQHGPNGDSFEALRSRWESFRSHESTFGETLTFLRSAHQGAPFLFFNGNTFAALGRALFDALTPGLSAVRKQELRSFVGHYVSGTVELDELTMAFDSLSTVDDLKKGDRVETLRGTTKGVVRKILEDGRIEWKTDAGDILKGSLESLRRLP